MFAVLWFNKPRILTKEVQKEILVYPHFQKTESIANIKKEVDNMEPRQSHRLRDPYGEYSGIRSYGVEGCVIVDYEWSTADQKYYWKLGTEKKITWEQFHKKYPAYQEETTITISEKQYKQMIADLEEYHKAISGLDLDNETNIKELDTISV